MHSQRRRKVLFVIRALDIGGAERQLIELASGLRVAGWDVKLATFYSGGGLEPLARARQVPLVCLNKRSRWDVVRFSARLLRFLREEQADVVYTVLAMSNILVTLLKPFIERTRIVWGVVSSDMDLSYYDWLARVELRLQVWLSRRADAIICNSQAGRDYHLRLGYPAASCAVIPNGIDTSHFRPDPEARAAVRKTWHVDDRVKLIGIVGRLDPIKDHRNFLQAAAQVCAQREDVRFVCIGDGLPSYKSQLLALSDELGLSERVMWIPAQKEVWPIYNALDVLVTASISEGLTNVVAEAMATGIPAIGTDVGDSALLIRQRRWLCPPRNAAALARVMENVLDDLPCDAGALRSYIEDRYSLRALIDSTSSALSATIDAGVGDASPEYTPAPKIVFLTRALDIGGAQRQMAELAKGLRQVGWTVTIVTFYPGGELAAGLAAAGIKLVSLEKTGRWDVLLFLVRLTHRLRHERADVIHGYLDTPNLLLGVLRPFLRPARVVWGLRASNMDLSRYDGLARAEFQAAAWLSRAADLIVCNSEAGRRYHAARGFADDRMVVIPNGVDVSRFRPNAEERRQIRAEWDIRDDEKLVGIVARIDPMKDHHTFLKAVSTVAGRRDNVRFVAVGDGPEPLKEALQQQSMDSGLHGRVFWAGAREDVERIYNALDVLVSSSAFGEGFPNTIVEAMATGVPCVVTDVGDSRQIVTNLGWVCSPRNSRQLADAITAALDAIPCDAAIIRERVTSQYDASALVERTVSALAPLVYGSQSPGPHVEAQ